MARLVYGCSETSIGISGGDSEALPWQVESQIESWQSNSAFVSASVHQSLDGVRVFTYSQWQPYWEGLARNEFHLYHVVHSEVSKGT